MDRQTIKNGAVTNFADKTFNEVTFRLALRYQLVDAFGGLGLRGAPRQIFGGVRVALP